MKSSGVPLWSFEWKCLYHLFCGWLNEHMMLSHERFFYFIESIPCQFIFGFICSIAWSSVKSNQLAVTHSDDNKSRHYHFYLGPSLKQEENEIFLSGGRITYDPFMSCWEPLKIIIHHSSTWTLKGTECYKSDGICIFCLPSRKQAKEITWFILKTKKKMKRLQNMLRS